MLLKFMAEVISVIFVAVVHVSSDVSAMEWANGKV